MPGLRSRAAITASGSRRRSWRVPPAYSHRRIGTASRSRFALVRMPRLIGLMLPGTPNRNRSRACGHATPTTIARDSAAFAMLLHRDDDLAAGVAILHPAKRVDDLVQRAAPMDHRLQLV